MLIVFGDQWSTLRRRRKYAIELRLGDLVGWLAVEGAQHPHRSGVGILRAFAFAVELQGVDGALVPVGHHRSLLLGKSGHLAVRCTALPEENRGRLAWLDPRSGHPDGRRTTLAEDETCREAAYLNSVLERTAGSHALAAAAQHERSAA
jgi:hypothetical protein